MHEEDLLHRYGHLPVSSIRLRLAEQGFERSCAAIRVKVTRLRVKANLDGYSACALAAALGVDAHKILLWIRGGLLAAKRRGTQRVPDQGGDIWWITRRAVKQFVLRAPEEIDLARVEKLWFLDLVTNGRICRWLATGCARSGRSVDADRIVTCLQMPASLAACLVSPVRPRS